MAQTAFHKLQNGSDIRGVALEGVAGEPVNLTTDAVYAIAAAFGVWLSQKSGKALSECRVAIGRDSRLSGPGLLDAAAAGLSSLGVHVADCSVASTPAMFMSLVTDGFSFDGSIMITASHLPFNRNGMKFFLPAGGLEKSDIAEILTLAEKGDFPAGEKTGRVEPCDFISEYAKGLVQKIRAGAGSERPLEGFRIVVDAGNGAGGFFVSKVLSPLGADTTGSQFLDPDGTFPNHIPNPEDKAAMDSICKAVIDNRADLGIIFDTDVDRAGAVDRNGKEINRNRIIALISAILLSEHPGSAIVTDSITSSGLKKFIEEKGGIHHRFRRGYKNVINEAIRLNETGTECHVAIETSGHGALKENYFLDDGAYLIAKILIQMARLAGEGRTIDELIADLEEPLEAEEYRMKILCEDFKGYGKKLIEELTAYAGKQAGWMIEPDNYEGIRVQFGAQDGDGWFLLRLSLHDPIIPLNIESNAKGGVQMIVSKLSLFLAGYDQLDRACLTSGAK